MQAITYEGYYTYANHCYCASARTNDILLSTNSINKHKIRVLNKRKNRITTYNFKFAHSPPNRTKNQVLLSLRRLARPDDFNPTTKSLNHQSNTLKILVITGLEQCTNSRDFSKSEFQENGYCNLQNSDKKLQFNQNVIVMV